MKVFYCNRCGQSMPDDSYINVSINRGPTFLLCSKECARAVIEMFRAMRKAKPCEAKTPPNPPSR